ITSMLHVSDDPASIREQLRTVADSGRVDVLLTTGGTGIGPRDNTPEATQAVADRIVPGLSEDRKSTRLNSSHEWSSYAVSCLKKKQPTLPSPVPCNGGNTNADDNATGTS